MDVPTEDAGGAAVEPTAAPAVIAGRFTILREIGRGAMGTVYEARNEWTHRHVAVKVMHGAASHAATARFVQQARLAARLSHPHIVDVLDMGRDATGSLYLVQELLDGESLDARLGRGPLDAAEVLTIFTPLADALALAHAHAVVHRDVKPSNVMLARASRAPGIVPKLVDFGVAFDANAEAATRLSTAGTLTGTPHYMPPESVRGVVPSSAGDVWALGICLYEAPAGRLPYTATKQLQVLLAEVLSLEPRRIGKELRGIHAGLADVVAAALHARSRYERPSSTSPGVARGGCQCRSASRPGVTPTLA